MNESPWPLKAYKNIDFLNRPAARQIRILCELTEPAERFRKEHIRNTIIFFGSARIPDTATAQKGLLEAEAALQVHPDDAGLKRALLTARRLFKAAPYHDKARELARLMAEWSKSLPARQRFHICTGGGFGMMEAANHGAHQAGEKSVGLGISLPFEQTLNPYIPEELQFEFHYFMVRKYWFAYLAKAMVVCPGGFGTMDELFEMLTLIQTHKTQKYLPTVLLGCEFWNSILNFEAFVEWGVISPEDLGLFRIFDDPVQARDWLVEEITDHYLKRSPEPTSGLDEAPLHECPEPGA